MRQPRIILCFSIAANIALTAYVLFLWDCVRAARTESGHAILALREQVKELEGAARSRPTPQPALDHAEVLELARLRNEVTRLRNDLHRATNTPTLPRAAPAAAAPSTTAPPAAEVVTFTNSISTTLLLGHSLALGGWMEPGTGKRILSFVTPQTAPDSPETVLVQMRLMSVPDALLDRLGLQGLRAELPQPGRPPSFDAAQSAALLKAVEQTEGVDLLSAPRVLARSGHGSIVSVTQENADGTHTGPVFTLTPTLDANGTVVRLDVGLELNLAKKP
ncbi:MAG: hypothetical protein ACKODH_12360 [Limisphaerales bacterium]